MRTGRGRWEAVLRWGAGCGQFTSNSEEMVMEFTSKKNGDGLMGKMRTSDIGVVRCRFSPDGKQVAAADTFGRLEVHDVESGLCTLMVENAHSGPVCDICWNSSSKYVFSTGIDGALRVFTIARNPCVAICCIADNTATKSLNTWTNERQGSLKPQLGISSEFESAQQVGPILQKSDYSQQNILDENNKIDLFENPSIDETMNAMGTSSTKYQGSVGSNKRKGRYFAIDDDLGIKFWRWICHSSGFGFTPAARSGPGAAATSVCVDWSEWGGQAVFTGHSDGVICKWDLRSLNFPVASTDDLLSSPVFYSSTSEDTQDTNITSFYDEDSFCMTDHRESEILSSNSLESIIRGWGQPRAGVRGHTGAVHSLTLAGDCRTLISASQDGFCRLWESRGLRAFRSILALDGRPCVHATLSLNDRFILCSCPPRRCRMWPAAFPSSNLSLQSTSDSPSFLNQDDSFSRCARRRLLPYLDLYPRNFKHFRNVNSLGSCNNQLDIFEDQKKFWNIDDSNVDDSDGMIAVQWCGTRDEKFSNIAKHREDDGFYTEFFNSDKDLFNLDSKAFYCDLVPPLRSVGCFWRDRAIVPLSDGCLHVWNSISAYYENQAASIFSCSFNFPPQYPFSRFTSVDSHPNPNVPIIAASTSAPASCVIVYSFLAREVWDDLDIFVG